jgi:hypothetical protein
MCLSLFTQLGFIYGVAYFYINLSISNPAATLKNGNISNVPTVKC